MGRGGSNLLYNPSRSDNDSKLLLLQKINGEATINQPGSFVLNNTLPTVYNRQDQLLIGKTFGSTWIAKCDTPSPWSGQYSDDISINYQRCKQLFWEATEIKQPLIPIQFKLDEKIEVFIAPADFQQLFKLYPQFMNQYAGLSFKQVAKDLFKYTEQAAAKRGVTSEKKQFLVLQSRHRPV